MYNTTFFGGTCLFGSVVTFFLNMSSTGRLGLCVARKMSPQLETEINLGLNLNSWTLETKIKHSWLFSLFLLPLRKGSFGSLNYAVVFIKRNVMLSPEKPKVMKAH